MPDRQVVLRRGFYWYRPADDEQVPDLQGDIQVVLVSDGSVHVTGGDITYRLAECRGELIGPLVPPESQDDERRRLDAAKERHYREHVGATFQHCSHEQCVAARKNYEAHIAGHL